VSHGTLLAALAQVAADSGDDASQRLSWVILALVGLAVVISIATVVFWRLTRPDRRPAEPAVRWVPAGETAASAESPSAPPTVPPTVPPAAPPTVPPTADLAPTTDPAPPPDSPGGTR
jgi:hypothetical protein